MLIDSDSAYRFINGYKAVLLELHRVSGEPTPKDIVSTLACARSYLKQNPESLDVALSALEAEGTAVAPDVKQALKSLRIERWVYLRSTTRYAIFIDQAAKNAYAVLGLTNPIEAIVGRRAVMFESGVFPFVGHYVCDGIVQSPVFLGPGYKAQFKADLADIKKQGHFHTKPDTQSIWP